MRTTDFGDFAVATCRGGGNGNTRTVVGYLALRRAVSNYRFESCLRHLRLLSLYGRSRICSQEIGVRASVSYAEGQWFKSTCRYLVDKTSDKKLVLFLYSFIVNENKMKVRCVGTNTT